MALMRMMRTDCCFQSSFYTIRESEYANPRKIPIFLAKVQTNRTAIPQYDELLFIIRISKSATLSSFRF